MKRVSAALIVINLIVLISQTIFFLYTNKYLVSQTTSLTDQINNLSNKIDQPTNETITKALAELKEELIKYRTEQKAETHVLGLTTTNPSQDPDDLYASLNLSLDKALATLENKIQDSNTKMIKLKSSWQSVDVYEQPKASSRIIGQAVTNQNYPVVNHQNTWYQIKLENNKEGFIQAQFIDENTY